MKFIKNLHTNVKARIVTNFLRKFGNELTVPLMTLYLAKIYGMANAGAIIFVILCSGVFTSLYGGYLSDKIGRKSILVNSELLHFFSLFGMMISLFQGQPLLLLLFYCTKNFAVTFSFSSGEALVVDSSDSEQRTNIFSIMIWVNCVSLSLGAMVGSFLYEEYFFYLIFFSSLISLSVFFIYLFFTKNQTHPSIQNSGSEPFLRSYLDVIKDGKYIVFLCSLLCFSFLRFQLSGYISLRIVDEIHEVMFFNYVKLSGVEFLGVLKAENALLTIFLIYFVNIIFSRLNNFHRFYYGAGLFIISFAFLARSTDAYLLFVMLAMSTIGELGFSPVGQTIITNLIPTHSRSKYLSIYHLHARFGNILSSLGIIAGAFFSPLVMSISFLLIGILGLSLAKIIEWKAEKEMIRL